MSKATTLQDIIKSLSLDTVTSVIGATSSGDLHRASPRSLENIAFSSVSNSDDLDNPTTKGIFNVSKNTTITKPDKGYGWEFGYIINLAIATGIQVWINFSGFIAVRGKGSVGGAWSGWSVMAKM